MIGIALDDAVDDGPDGQEAQQENSGENQNGHDAPFEPAIEQIGDKIAQIQDYSVDEDRCHQGQLFDLVEDVHAASKEGQDGQRKNAGADLPDGQHFQNALLMQNQIQSRKDQGAEAAGGDAPAEEIKNMVLHVRSYLLRIWVKQRLETYSR